MIELLHDLIELRKDEDLRSQPRKTAAVIMVAVLILIGGIVYGFIRAPKDNSSSLNAEYQEALDEASSLPEGQGKIVLTQRLLKATYLKMRGSVAKFDAVDSILLSIAVFAAVMFFGLGAIKIHGIHQRGASIDMSQWVTVIIGSFIVIVILACVIILPRFFKRPKPEESQYWVDTLQVTRKETRKESSGRHTTTAYYIYYELSGQEIPRKVQTSIYNAIADPGIYYFAYSSDDSTHECFGVYPDTKYVKEADPSESAS